MDFWELQGRSGRDQGDRGKGRRGKGSATAPWTAVADRVSKIGQYSTAFSGYCVPVPLGPIFQDVFPRTKPAIDDSKSGCSQGH